MNENEDIASSPTDGLLENELPSPREKKMSEAIPYNKNSLVFHDINYTVSMKKKIQKQILFNCSGTLQCGLNAILGPTGAGKTSLLDILAGRRKRNEFTGDVLSNGEYQRSDFRLASGFVVQEDIVMGTLTVRENLAFSAALRLPKNFSKQDREQRVEMVVQDLGLYNCVDSKVGTTEVRGISGGERRRTSIGMELIISPKFLFLDEPTTGLDASTACSVMELLKRQGEKGRTIIFSIHQPRYSVFKQFDTLTLLSAGEIVYHGEAKDALSYFNELGYGCETYNNPADHFLDVISQNEKAQRDAVHLKMDGTEEVNTGESLSSQFSSSRMSREIQARIQPILHEAQTTNNDPVHVEQYSYQSSFFKQIWFLSKRASLNLIRDPRLILSQVLINIFMGLVIGAIYWKVDFTMKGLRNRAGVFFLLSTNMVFSNMSAVIIFLTEKMIFRNESANGYYRCSSYFIVKVLCDLIPLRLIPITFLSVIAYFMIGLQLEVDKFFVFVMTLLSMTMAAASLCFFVSSSVDLVAIANVMCSLPFVLMMIFSGFLNNLTTIPEWIRWLKYISIFKYGFGNLLLNEVHGETFGNCTMVQYHHNHTCVVQTGDAYLESIGIHVDDLWWNELALGIIIVCFLLLAYVQLRRLKKR